MNNTEKAFNYIIEHNTPAKINGTAIDLFTAKMVHVVASKLTEENRRKLFNMPINEIVALSYKIITHKK